MAEEPILNDQTMVYEPKDYEKQFDGEAYLQHFYSKDAMEDGTRLCLFALPAFAAFLEKNVPEDQRRRLVDIGAGPTVYSAVCFRNVVKEIYLTDFLQQNLDHLDDWINERRAFDWKPVVQVIARTEGYCTYPDPCQIMETESREAVLNGGLYRSNVHEPTVLLDAPNVKANFDIMVSVFCLESACTELTEYDKAMSNMIKLIRPGGFLILGSVIEDDCYTAGVKEGKVTFFTLLSLTEEIVLETLKKNGCQVLQQFSLTAQGATFILVKKNDTEN